MEVNAMVPPRDFATFEDFLVWERRQERKHDLVDGWPIARLGITERHAVIQSNLLAYAHLKLRGTGCRALPASTFVKTGLRSGSYPDMTVDCGPPNSESPFAPQPTVVFEVERPEVKKDDRTFKLSKYNQVRTLAYYVVVEPAKPLVHIYSRVAAGEFGIEPQEFKSLADVFELPEVALKMSMADVYDAVKFD